MSRKRKSWKIRGSFVPFITEGLILLAFFAVAFSIGNYSLYEKAQISELTRLKEREVVNSASHVESVLTLIQDFSLEIAYDWDVISYCDNNNNGAQDRQQVINRLRMGSNAHDYIQSMVLISTVRGEILTSHEGWFDKDDFYDQDIVDIDTLNHYANTGCPLVGRSFVNRSGESHSVITYINELFTIEDKSANYLVTNIGIGELLKAIAPDRWKYGTEILVCDKDRATILDNSGSELTTYLDETEMPVEGSCYSSHVSYKGSDGILVLWRSDYNGWIYTSVCPINVDYKPVSFLQGTSIVLVSVAILCSVLFLFLFSVKIYRPYKEMVQKINRANTIMSENDEMSLKAISGYLDSILCANEEMQDVYLESLLISDRKRRQDAFSTQWLPENYVVLLFKPFFSQEPDVSTVTNMHNQLRIVLTKLLNIQFPDITEDSYRYINLSGREVALLIQGVYYEEVMENTEWIIRALKQLNMQNLICEWCVAMSEKHGIADEMHKAYRECCVALEFRYFYPEMLIYRYNSLKNVPRNTYLNNSLLGILSNKLLAMEYMQARNVILEIERDIRLNSEGVLYYNIPIIFIHMRYMVMKSLNTNGIPASPLFSDDEHLWFTCKSIHTLHQEVDSMIKLLEKTHQYVEVFFSSNAKPTAEYKLLEYVNNHFCEDISLGGLSEVFGMTSSYISSRFKEIAGIPFIKYVTLLRVNRIKELLLTFPDLRIADIAEQVGLRNAQNLIRIFKKVEGITPGQYRELNALSRNHKSGNR